MYIFNLIAYLSDDMEYASIFNLVSPTLHKFLTHSMLHDSRIKMENSLPMHLYLFTTLIFYIQVQVLAQINSSTSNALVSAIYAFGDSTVDPGNNNYIATAFRSDFPPYGRDFFTHMPTGRFTNGKLATDFAASYVGLKEELPPFLDWSLGTEELITGVSFASAGSGFDPFTAQIGGVIPIPEQINYFRDYINKLDNIIGMERRADVIKRAIFIISAGTNDFISYSTLPVRRQTFSIEGYHGFILQNVRDLLQRLSDFGAEKILFVGLPPIGCLPIVITLYANDSIHDRSCIQSHNALSNDYNRKLQILLNDYSTARKIHLTYVDVYNPLLDLILTPKKFGFEDSKVGCCGTGLIEASFLCNPKSLVCVNASKYVFWDSIHPTEKAYLFLFDTIRVLLYQIISKPNKK